jgi:hypothetical protein
MNARASEAQKRKKMMRKLVAETAILEHDYSSLSHGGGLHQKKNC